MAIAARLKGLLVAALAAPLALTATPAAAQTSGPDVTYQDVNGISNYGQVGGIYAYALGSYTCNIGDQNLRWGTSWAGSPILAMNAYRLHDGRLVQIGLSFGKKACCAASGSGCGSCNGTGGSLLGAGCRDIYSSGYNGGQSRLGPRSEVNAFTGAQSGASSGSGNQIFKRLQIAQSDMDPATYPGALYFVEGVYVGSDDAPAGNAYNNASYKRVVISPTTYSMTEQGSMEVGIPAIAAWRQHGNGLNQPDTSIKVTVVDVPAEGRFHVGAKAYDLGNGMWRYEYAIFNLNSHQSGGSVDIPVPAGVTVSNIGFHDVDYHSGEVYDNTDWVMNETADGVRWRSPQTFAENANSNALRWGTMYNYWFDASTAPDPNGVMTLGLFRPGAVDSVGVNGIPVPGVPPCIADWDESGGVDGDDITAFFVDWQAGTADVDGSGGVDGDDITAFFVRWQAGC